MLYNSVRNFLFTFFILSQMSVFAQDILSYKNENGKFVGIVHGEKESPSQLATDLQATEEIEYRAPWFFQTIQRLERGGTPISRPEEELKYIYFAKENWEGNSRRFFALPEYEFHLMNAKVNFLKQEGPKSILQIQGADANRIFDLLVLTFKEAHSFMAKVDLQVKEDTFEADGHKYHRYSLASGVTCWKPAGFVDHFRTSPATCELRVETTRVLK